MGSVSTGASYFPTLSKFLIGKTQMRNAASLQLSKSWLRNLHVLDGPLNFLGAMISSPRGATDQMGAVVKAAKAWQVAWVSMWVVPPCCSGRALWCCSWRLSEGDRVLWKLCSNLSSDKRATIITNWFEFCHHAKIREGDILCICFRITSKRSLVFTLHRL
ncbi:uncharacterized protein LOC125537850 isoform X2 [Triticum urartu]|uniref:uncharacterized protein LOC125527492 n=1 Tax=Triticum urartu TaxID=4572 RepID=UPI002043C6E1|nr:uncharacterized protein LOC125527492 [Triticum urartu]XP_048557124.1 uncharacterized protein LOC125537850 isoform X2 [Triticum urartu]